MAKLIIGLTGGIGSGKSAATRCFEKKGVPIVDADIVARDVVAPGSEGLSALTRLFGSKVLLNDGSLNRAALRELVFNNEEKKTLLESILHPLIKARSAELLQAAQGPYAIYSAPLLIESKGHNNVDRIVVVDVPEEVQLQRASQRDGQSPEQIKAIMKTQLSRVDRLSYADDIVDNAGDLNALQQQVEQLHQKYLTLSQQLQS